MKIKCGYFDEGIEKRRRFVVRDRETGTLIETVSTMEEGLALIEKYERDDMAECVYSEDFYEVVEVSA